MARTRRRGYRLAKRGLDASIAALGLLMLSPVMAVLALAVWLDLGSPVLFRQLRPGLHGEPFTLLKFRTMRIWGSDDDPSSDADRLTRLGRFLRSTSLDELPTLWNVLRGDMSLVGPRPLLMEYLELYSPEQARRHEVLPGVTGLAQVRGRNGLSWEEKFAADVEYVDNIGWRMDARVLLTTVRTVLSREGISAPGMATMAVFSGEANIPPARPHGDADHIGSQGRPAEWDGCR